MLANFLFATFRTQLFQTFWSDRKGKSIDRRSVSAKTQSSRKPSASTRLASTPTPLSFLYFIRKCKKVRDPFPFSLLFLSTAQVRLPLPNIFGGLPRSRAHRFDFVPMGKRGRFLRPFYYNWFPNEGDFRNFFLISFGILSFTFWVIVSVLEIVLNSIWSA